LPVVVADLESFIRGGFPERSTSFWRWTSSSIPRNPGSAATAGGSAGAAGWLASIERRPRVVQLALLSARFATRTPGFSTGIIRFFDEAAVQTCSRRRCSIKARRVVRGIDPDRTRLDLTEIPSNWWPSCEATRWRHISSSSSPRCRMSRAGRCS
jgi:hypothetical protein